MCFTYVCLFNYQSTCEQIQVLLYMEEFKAHSLGYFPESHLLVGNLSFQVGALRHQHLCYLFKANLIYSKYTLTFRKWNSMEGSPPGEEAKGHQSDIGKGRGYANLAIPRDLNWKQTEHEP